MCLLLLVRGQQQRLSGLLALRCAPSGRVCFHCWRLYVAAGWCGALASWAHIGTAGGIAGGVKVCLELPVGLMCATSALAAFGVVLWLTRFYRPALSVALHMAAMVPRVVCSCWR
jgi:hypothetical protein